MEPTATTESAAEEGERLDDILIELADGSLAAGDLDEAEARYRRVASLRADSARAQVGLGRVALARDRPDEARAHFEAALRADPDDVEALVGSGELFEKTGRYDEARRALARAVRLDPSHSAAHARLLALTGAAPRDRPGANPFARALAHPHDPWALVAAADELVRQGHADGAIGQLEKALWVADLDPASARRAIERLGELDPAWRGRRVVPVYAYVDPLLREQPGWRFQQRTVWLAASRTLLPILDVRFVLVSIGGFESRVPGDLDAVLGALSRQAPLPKAGVVALFTGEPIPEKPGFWHRGIAEFLGRRTVVRLEPGATKSRVLIHELIHLYGGVHVADEVESIMNPTGDSLKLDPMNQAIIAQVRGRTFRGVGIERDLLPHVDLGATINAYVSALSANLKLRQLGLRDAQRAAGTSRVVAARRAEDATALDPHLADVARNVARLMLFDKRRPEAAELLDAASILYGVGTPRGRAAARAAEAVRAQLAAEHGK